MNDNPSNLLNNLCSMPGLAHGTVTKEVLRDILLSTGGQLMACGRLYEIVSKHLGAGVYRVHLKLWGQNGVN